MGIFDRKQAAKKPPLTAAVGGIMRGGSPANPESIMRRTEDWQIRTLAYQDSVPEVAHAGSFVENTTSKVSFDVQSVDAMAARIVETELRSFPTGRVARNLFMVGEIIVGYKYNTDDGVTKWKAWGKRDYKYHGENKPLEVRGKDNRWKTLDSSWKWFRIWRPDPSEMYAAWSAHKAQLDLLEALYVHQLADTAVATSRLAGAGILYIPNDEFVDMPDLDGGEPEPGSQAHFEHRLRSAMSDSLSNRNAQDAVVPLVMFGSAEYGDAIKHVLMERRDDAEAFASRMNAYRQRYGAGIDLPEEVITGMGKTNHWAGWKVDQNTWNYYLEPLVEIISEALEKNFAKPVAQMLGATDDIQVVLDPTRVIVKPDRTDAAIRLFAAGALSAEGALEAAGFDVSQVAGAPPPEANAGTQPDGNVRMPSANFRGSEGEPIGDRNFER